MVSVVARLGCLPEALGKYKSRWIYRGDGELGWVNGCRLNRDRSSIFEIIAARSSRLGGQNGGKSTAEYLDWLKNDWVSDGRRSA